MQRSAKLFDLSIFFEYVIPHSSLKFARQALQATREMPVRVQVHATRAHTHAQARTRVASASARLSMSSKCLHTYVCINICMYM